VIDNQTNSFLSTSGALSSPITPPNDVEDGGSLVVDSGGWLIPVIVVVAAVALLLLALIVFLVRKRRNRGVTPQDDADLLTAPPNNDQYASLPSDLRTTTTIYNTREMLDGGNNGNVALYGRGEFVDALSERGVVASQYETIPRKKESYDNCNIDL
jgi:hypothetical protein